MTNANNSLTNLSIPARRFVRLLRDVSPDDYRATKTVIGRRITEATQSLFNQYSSEAAAKITEAKAPNTEHHKALTAKIKILLDETIKKRIEEFTKQLRQQAIALLQRLKPKQATDLIKQPGDIAVLSSLVDNHPLREFINKTTPLNTRDFYSLFDSKFIKLAIEIPEDGILVASEGETHQSAWTRDMAAVALGKMHIGDNVSAAKIARALYRAYASYEPTVLKEVGANGHKHDQVLNYGQREILNNFIHAQGDFKQNLWRSLDSRFTVPSTKFTIKTTQGKRSLVANEKPWGMQQLDAYGYFLTLASKLAANGDLDLAILDTEARKKAIDSGKAYTDLPKESTLVAMVRFLHKLEYWTAEDIAAWEDDNAFRPKRTTGIAACVSGLESVRQLFEKRGYFDNLDVESGLKCNDGKGYNLRKFKEELDRSINEGRKALGIIEDESGKALDQSRFREDGTYYEVDEDNKEFRHHDAALLFALTIADPKAIGFKEKHEQGILKTVYGLMGDIAQTRFRKDKYEGENWIYNSNQVDDVTNADHNPHLENSAQEVVAKDDYKAAEWCMFDPYLASYFYNKFIKSGGADIMDFLIADRHTRRALAQVAKASTEYPRPNKPGSSIKVEAGSVLESYWYDSIKQAWIPGENKNLNWSKIAVQEMIMSGVKAAKLYESLYFHRDLKLVNDPVKQELIEEAGTIAKLSQAA